MDILREFLEQGASVHLRNRSGHTPLYLAAAAGLGDHVSMLLHAGAHLHSDETAAAQLHASQGEGEGQSGGSGSGSSKVWEAVLRGA